MFLGPHAHVAFPPPYRAQHAARTTPHRSRSELGVGARHVRTDLEVGVFEALRGGRALVWVPLQTVLDELQRFCARVGQEGL